MFSPSLFFFFFFVGTTDLVHQKCLEKIVSELPADTARGGFTCPKCSKPLFSSNDISGDSLATALATRLHDLPWAAALLSTINSTPAAATDSAPSPAKEGESPEAPAKPEAPEGAAEPASATTAAPEAAPAPSASVSVPSPPPSAAAAAAASPAPKEKQSASSLFIQQSLSKNAHPPSSQAHQHQKPQSRSTVATGVPGVGLFVPPPPPKTQSTDAAPVMNSVLPSLPVEDSHGGEDASGDEFLNIQIPPLGSRLAARKTLPLGGDYGSNRLYDDDDDDKHHNSAFVQVAGYFGLTKRERGRIVVDKKRVAIACLIIVLGLFFLVRVLSLMKTRPQAVPTETGEIPANPGAHVKINDVN